jgi:hypothetical protein
MFSLEGSFSQHENTLLGEAGDNTDVPSLPFHVAKEVSAFLLSTKKSTSKANPDPELGEKLSSFRLLRLLIGKFVY